MARKPPTEEIIAGDPSPLPPASPEASQEVEENPDLGDEDFKMDTDETPRERFLRLGSARVGKALKAIAMLEALADRTRSSTRRKANGEAPKRVYEYDDEDVEKITDALATAIDRVETALTSGKRGASGFAF